MYVAVDVGSLTAMLYLHPLLPDGQGRKCGNETSTCGGDRERERDSDQLFPCQSQAVDLALKRWYLTIGGGKRLNEAMPAGVCVPTSTLP